MSIKTRKINIASLLVLGSMFFLVLTGPTSLMANEAKINPVDGAANDYFGRSVRVCGQYVIVSSNGNGSGSAYIFEQNGSGWVQAAKLLAADGASSDAFGFSVAMSGDYAIVGAYLTDENEMDSGSAYIFKRDGINWTQQAKLTASDADVGDWFGKSVSISGDYAIVGAYYNDDNGDKSGSAYIFKRDGTIWSQQKKLTAGDAEALDWFGVSVSIFGDYAIVGAQKNDDNGVDSGSAYIFKRDGTNWTQRAKLTASDGEAFDSFGVSVDLYDYYAIVGAMRHDAGAGTAYIFKRSGGTWTQQTHLMPSDRAAQDYFGGSVSIYKNYVIVGARGDDDNGSSSGSAYIFKRNGMSWTQNAKLTAFDGALNDLFGFSVSVSGDYAVVGAYSDDDNGSNSGSAYVFDEICLPGDIDDSGDLDLTDAILALKVLAGIVPASEVYKETDVNNDGKIGLEEVIFILQDAAGLRLNPPEED